MFLTPQNATVKKLNFNSIFLSELKYPNTNFRNPKISFSSFNSHKHRIDNDEKNGYNNFNKINP